MNQTDSDYSSVVVMTNVSRSFDDVKSSRAVLDNVDFKACSGNLVAITGPSGSGKSTFLHLLGGIDIPDHGRILVKDTDMTCLNETGRTLFRRKNIGLVFQSFNRRKVSLD